MNDVEGGSDLVHGFVRGVEAVQCVAHDSRADGGEDWGVDSARSPEQARKIVAMDVLHDQEDLLGLLQQDHIKRPTAPNSRPKWTVAIPPDAISSYMT